MYEPNVLEHLEKLLHIETALIGGLREPLDICCQLSAQAIEISKNLNGAQDASGGSGAHELFLLAACLACRYRISLSDIVPACSARDAHGSGDLRGEDFRNTLLATVRETEEAVRMYEGRIFALPEENRITLATRLAALVELAFAVGDLQIANLYAAVFDLIKQKRDGAASLEYTYHPSDAPTLRSFEVVQMKTACPYAKAARLWGAPRWDRDQSIDENIRRIAVPLSRFVYLQKWETLDGFVVGVTDDRLVGDMKSLSRTLRMILKSLTLLDQFAPNLFDREVKSKDWYFEFLGIRMFLIVFSPLYGHDSPRETYGEKSTFILFQPQQSFVQNKALRNDERNENRSILVGKFSQRFSHIRARFADVGKPYDCPIMMAPFQAPRFLKPFKLGEPEIEWWKDD
jgi:hypothetical protein